MAQERAPASLEPHAERDHHGLQPAPRRVHDGEVALPVAQRVAALIAVHRMPKTREPVDEAAWDALEAIAAIRTSATHAPEECKNAGRGEVGDRDLLCPTPGLHAGERIPVSNAGFATASSAKAPSR